MADWRLVSVDPEAGKMVYELDLDENSSIIKTETLLPDAFFGMNKALRDHSEGVRFGEGQIVASMPLHVYYASDLFKAQQAGDNAGVKKFLNDFENRGYRTFRGDI